IYKKSGKDGKWKKLIPGSNPQWTKSGHFYYFLRVGYSAYAELWQANSDGGELLRISKSDYFIGIKSPIVSKNGKNIAYQNSLSNADGGFEVVVLIQLRGISDEAPATVILKKKPYTKVKLLGWIGNNTLNVNINGVVTKIDI
ncbi:MAG: hypothetical protein GY799_30880, partial [Desulfobulbaceae bacterium]|nr:hypothetical protein [Desulfobulbaceae bacterium]